MDGLNTLDTVKKIISKLNDRLEENIRLQHKGIKDWRRVKRNYKTWNVKCEDPAHIREEFQEENTVKMRRGNEIMVENFSKLMKI